MTETEHDYAPGDVCQWIRKPQRIPWGGKPTRQQTTTVAVVLRRSMDRRTLSLESGTAEHVRVHNLAPFVGTVPAWAKAEAARVKARGGGL